MRRVLILDTQVLVAQDLAETLRSILPDAQITVATPPEIERTPDWPTRFDAAFIGNEVKRLRGKPATEILASLADRIVQYGEMSLPDPSLNSGFQTLLWPFSDEALKGLIDRWRAGR